MHTSSTSSTSSSPTPTINTDPHTPEGAWASIASPAGYILAVSYPVLALSTGARALYQLFVRTDIPNYLPVYLSSIAALCYLTATIGFAYRRRWTWWLSLIVLCSETLLSFIVGVWSFIDPELIGRTVWRHFGEDYGYFPLFQPLLGVAWLLWPQTMRLYNLRNRFVRPPVAEQPGDMSKDRQSL